MRSRIVGIVVLALGILLASLEIDAQQPAKIPRLGWLRAGSPPDHLFEAFRQGLRDLGYVEGQNISIEQRYAEGKPDRLPTLAAELVGLKVDVIVTSTTPAILAAKQATSTIPIVMALSGDPVGAGLVASLARPGGNVTGLSNLAPELSGKRLELLKAAFPKVTRLAYVWDPANRALALRLREMEVAAGVLGIAVQSIEVRRPNEIESAFAAMTKERVEALLVPAPVGFLYRKQIMGFATKRRLPVMYDTREFVEAGGLMAYGPNFPEMFRRSATYVDKILKGAKPADLPVEQPTRFELLINMKTAKALGLTIPQSVLIRADQVIQ